MSVEGVLAAGRTAALKLLRDTCTVDRKTGETLDPDTGLIVETWTTVYPVGDEIGRCRVKPRSSSETEWGEREVSLQQLVAVLPWDASAQVRREDRLTVTASDDAWLIGRPLEVIGISLAGTSTARRLLVEDKEG